MEDKMAEAITKSTFASSVLQSELPALVDFWAPWCGPCRMVGPIIDELAQELSGKVNVFKVNVDEQEELASEYGIVSIPSILIFNNGKLVHQEVGFKTKEALLAKLKEFY